MPIEWASLPLAWMAGVLSVLSPCVWPLIPIVMGSAAASGRRGPLFLALGLSLAFAVSGVFLTYILIGFGLDPDAYRNIAAALLVIVGLVLLVKPLGEWLNLKLSMFTGRFNTGSGTAETAAGQFAVGALLGLVWLPCVGPTLGAAIALASVGQDFGKAFMVMLSYGLGTAMALLLASYAAAGMLGGLRPGMLGTAAKAKQFLGGLLVFLGLLTLTGLDKGLETLAVRHLPDWAVSW